MEAFLPSVSAWKEGQKTWLLFGLVFLFDPVFVVVFCYVLWYVLSFIFRWILFQRAQFTFYRLLVLYTFWTVPVYCSERPVPYCLSFFLSLDKEEFGSSASFIVFDFCVLVFGCSGPTN